MVFNVGYVDTQAHLHQPAHVVVVGFGKAVELEPGDVKAGVLVGVDVVDDGVEGRLAGQLQQFGYGYFVAVGFLHDPVLPRTLTPSGQSRL